MERARTMRETGSDSHPAIAGGDTFETRVQAILRHGLRPRNRAERQAERAVAYGDHLQALVDEIREAEASLGDQGKSREAGGCSGPRRL